MDIFETTYFRFNKELLFYIGQWPLQTWNERYFYWTMTALIMASSVVPQLIKFVESFGDLDAMIECLPVMSVHLRCVVKFINCNIHATEMKKMFNRIKDDWSVKTDEFNKTILRPYAEHGRLLTMGYAAYMFCGITMYLLMPLVPLILDVVIPLNQSRYRIHLYQTEYFVDEEEKYFYILIHGYITMPMAVAIMVAYDTMYAIYVEHACGIFAMLKFRLRNIGDIASNNELDMCRDPVNHADKVYGDIVACIKMHNEAIEFVRVIESSNCFCLLFVVGASVLTTTVTGFVTLTNLNQPGKVLGFGIVVIGEFIHFFWICRLGHVIIEHSEDIFLNAYNANWSDLSPRAKKLLLLIMLRSWEPCKLTAGKVFVLSMENYATAMKTSMSYFTVLLQRRNKD